MQIHRQESFGNACLHVASRIYQAGLSLYPQGFRVRFKLEMQEVFKDALDEHAQKGALNVIAFIGRELLETPISILNQHIGGKSFWAQPFSTNILAFTLGFTLLGLSNILTSYPGPDRNPPYLLTLLNFLLVGAICSLAIGSILDPRGKKRFVFCGAFGFLLANTVGSRIFFGFFPDGFAARGLGIDFLIPFLYPILQGSFFGLFIGIAARNWPELVRWTCQGSLSLLAGFILNRLSAALMQSYIFQSPTQAVAQIGVIGFLLPYLLEGILLGILFGGFTQKRILIRQ